nr:glutathione S-transferase theta-1-like [Onthophagus taurus]
MSLKLYFDLMSQPSRALFIMLKKYNIPFQECLVNLGKGEHMTDEYSNEVSRFQKVPVIKDGDFILTESIAILRYLQREKGLPEHIYPSTSKEQARVDEFLEWQHNNLRLFCASYFQFKFLLPRTAGIQMDEGIVNLYTTKMEETLDNMEKLWIQNKAFINGDKISAADIWAICEIEQPRMAGYNPREGRPILNAWMDRVQATLNPYFDEAHKIVNKIVSKSKAKL